MIHHTRDYHKHAYASTLEIEPLHDPLRRHETNQGLVNNIALVA